MTLSEFLNWLCIVQLISGVMSVDTSSLQALLSPGARIDSDASQSPRWSEYKAPRPGSVVHPATEEDVQITVKWAINRSVPFLVQNGGNGWATTFKLDQTGILIHLDQLRSVTFNSNNTQATVEGGALISDVVAAAAAHSALVLTGTCNCVGALGAMLGGGFSNLMGQYGLAVDNFVSLNLVKPNGEAVTVTPRNAGLWWALRGAGPNFGVVTSAVLKAYPVPASRLSAWTGPLVFQPAQLEPVVRAIQNLTLAPEMALSLNFINQAGSPIILTTVFYHGTEDTGRAAFKSLFDIGPIADSTAVQPYAAWNDGSNGPCVKGGRRPNWGVGLASMDPGSWRDVYDVWAELIKWPSAENSSVLMNLLPTDKARSLPDSSSAYPFRSTVKMFAVFGAFYRDPAFDATAVSYGQRARRLWQATDGLAQHSTYINNAFGDESLQTIYGNSLERLRQLKEQIDPEGRFNEWFPLS